MSNGRGEWNQHYRDTISMLYEKIELLQESIKSTSILDRFKPSFRKKCSEVNEEIESLRKAIKRNQLEMYD